jgi:hypothetical protein
LDYVDQYVQLETGEWINVADLPPHVITEERMEAAAEVAKQD